MRTVLLLSEDEALDTQLQRALPDCSVFPTPTNEEALRTLRLTEVDLILKHVTQPHHDLEDFIAKARQLRPSVVIVCILPTQGLSQDDEAAAESADFVVLHPFTTQQLRAVLHQAEEKLRLLQEVTALRAVPRPGGQGHLSEEPEFADEGSSRELNQGIRQGAGRGLRSPARHRSIPRRRLRAGPPEPERHPSRGRRAPAVPRARFPRARAPRGRIGQPLRR